MRKKSFEFSGTTPHRPCPNLSPLITDHSLSSWALKTERRRVREGLRIRSMCVFSLKEKEG